MELWIWLEQLAAATVHRRFPARASRAKQVIGALRAATPESWIHSHGFHNFGPSRAGPPTPELQDAGSAIAALDEVSRRRLIHPRGINLRVASEEVL